MAHPFFEVPKFPSSRPEAVRMLRMLINVLQNPGQINILYNQCAANLPPLALLQAPDVIWAEALQNLTSHGALRRLCDVVRQQFQNAETQSVILEIENAQPAKETRIVSEYVLVLDRVGLRQQLEKIEPDMAPMKVLLVRGNPGSGKTHGRHLFELAAFDQGAQPVYLCDGIVVTVDDVVDQLFSALGRSAMKPERGDTTDEAWYKNVCVKLQEAAQDRNKPLWIAVDDLGPAPGGGPLLDTEIRKFCEQFALNMMNPAFKRWFRLMLIHYPEGSTPTKWKREFWTEDRTTDSDVQQGDVADLLRTWSAIKNRKLVETEVNELAARVVENAEAALPAGQEPLPRLQRIHDELIKALGDLAKETP